MVDLISMETGQLSPEQPQASYLDLLPIELILAIADQVSTKDTEHHIT